MCAPRACSHAYLNPPTGTAFIGGRASPLIIPAFYAAAKAVSYRAVESHLLRMQYTHTHTHMHAHTQTHTHTHTHTHTRTHTQRMYVCMYVCMYIRTYVCVYVCMYVCMYCTYCVYEVAAQLALRGAPTIAFKSCDFASCTCVAAQLRTAATCIGCSQEELHAR